MAEDLAQTIRENAAGPSCSPPRTRPPDHPRDPPARACSRTTGPVLRRTVTIVQRWEKFTGRKVERITGSLKCD